MKTVNLLWTSGWDSTYRLLELILVQKRRVQPYYLIDRGRGSLQVEIKTMEKLRKLILKKDQGAADLLLPTIFQEINEIKPNKNISKQYQNLLKIGHLGSQYEWLALFAAEKNLNDLELCVDTVLSGFFPPNIKSCFIKEAEGENNNFYNFRLQDNPPNPDLKLFSYYRFPIHDLGKLGTEKLAKKYGFLDIMENTWFCHTPKFNSPCGTCSPCRQALKLGLGRRIPLTGKARNFVMYTVKDSIKKMLKPEQVTFLKKVLRRKEGQSTFF
jgi:hypothetical protein